MKNKGFTLSEVLITLGIIGVIAAMTLPTLIGKYKEKVLVAQVKKSYSQLKNALKMYAAKNECSDTSCISDVNISSEELTRRFFEQFKGGFLCDSNSKAKSCLDTYMIKSNTPTNNGLGLTGYGDTFSTPYFIAPDGSSYKVIQRPSCIYISTFNKRDENGFYIDEDGDGVYDTIEEVTDCCAILYFDANGPHKGPNQFGADVYRIDLKSNGKFIFSIGNLNKTLSTDKLYYTPYNPGTVMKFD